MTQPMRNKLIEAAREGAGELAEREPVPSPEMAALIVDAILAEMESPTPEIAEAMKERAWAIFREAEPKAKPLSPSETETAKRHSLAIFGAAIQAIREGK